jgi:hypothetical protein
MSHRVPFTIPPEILYSRIQQLYFGMTKMATPDHPALKQIIYVLLLAKFGRYWGIYDPIPYVILPIVSGRKL